MSMQDVAVEVARTPGRFMKVSMRQLRDAHGSRGLGARVVEDIHAEMIEAGLGHCGHPGTHLPTRQDVSVWVYSQDAPIADLIREIQGHGRAEATVQMIRDLVTVDA